MILQPLLTRYIRPVYPWVEQIRHLRPTIKLGKDRFQVCIDVHQFTKNEIRVKALPEYVIVEGKQERKTKTGFIIRQFVKKFKLPDGCSPKTMKTELSAEGILTITAPRKFYETNFPCETLIPISEVGSRKKEESSIQAQEPIRKDICDAYKVKSNVPGDKKPS